MTDNKKLLKEFANIYASCNRAKQGAIAEIGKIDEKYKKLAEKEKEQLNALVKALDEQMALYGNYLGLNKPEEEAVEIAEEQEEVVEDTIFPENNEPEEKPEEKVEEKVEEKLAEPKKKGLTKEDIINGLENAGIVSIDTAVEEKKDEVPATDAVEWNPEPVVSNTANATELVMDENGWAQFPEDWK